MENRFENFTFLILRASKLIQKIKNLEMKEFDLKAVHVMCLYYLHNANGGLTSTELVKLTLEDKAAISRAIGLLEKKKLISYSYKKYNGLITITSQGLEVARLIDEKAMRAVNAGGSSLSEEERQNFYKTLRLITNNLDIYYNNKKKGNDSNEYF